MIGIDNTTLGHVQATGLGENKQEFNHSSLLLFSSRHPLLHHLYYFGTFATRLSFGSIDQHYSCFSYLRIRYCRIQLEYIRQTTWNSSPVLHSFCVFAYILLVVTPRLQPILLDMYTIKHP
jgi:hypothetical protein